MEQYGAGCVFMGEALVNNQKGTFLLVFIIFWWLVGVVYIISFYFFL